MYKKLFAKAMCLLSLSGFATTAQSGTEFQARIRTIHNYYVTATHADENWVLRGRSEHPDAWESFIVMLGDQGTLKIKTAHQKFCVATGFDDEHLIRGSADQADAWEKFQIIRNDDHTFSLKTAHNKYITATGEDEGFVIRGSADENHAWEKFLLIIEVGPSDLLEPKSSCSPYSVKTDFQIPMCDLAYASDHVYSKSGFQAKNSPHSYYVEKVSSSCDIKAVLYLCQGKNFAILAYRGTESRADLINDKRLFMGGAKGCQTVKNHTLRTYEEMKKYVGDRDLYVCGHSLGGIAAQILSSVMKVKGAAFNTFGPAGLNLKKTAEFYIHNTECYLHHAGTKFLTKPSIHRGVSHRMRTFIDHHFDKGCELSLEGCGSDYKPGWLTSYMNNKGQEYMKIVSEVNHAHAQWDRNHHDQAILHAAKAALYAAVPIFRIKKIKL